MANFSSDTVTAMRAALDEVCQQMPLSSTSLRTQVASRILERAKQGNADFEDFKEAGYLAVLGCAVA